MGCSPEIFAVKSKPLSRQLSLPLLPAPCGSALLFYFYFLPPLKTSSLLHSSCSRPTPWQTSNLTVPGGKKAVLTKIDQPGYFLWQCSLHAVIPLLHTAQGGDNGSQQGIHIWVMSHRLHSRGSLRLCLNANMPLPFFLNLSCSREHRNGSPSERLHSQFWQVLPVWPWPLTASSVPQFLYLLNDL